MAAATAVVVNRMPLQNGTWCSVKPISTRYNGRTGPKLRSTNCRPKTVTTNNVKCGTSRSERERRVRGLGRCLVRTAPAFVIDEHDEQERDRSRTTPTPGTRGAVPPPAASTPPMAGPSAGPSRCAVCTHPIAAARCSGGADSAAIVIAIAP